MSLSPDLLFQLIAQRDATLADNLLLIQLLMGRLDSLLAVVPDSVVGVARCVLADTIKVQTLSSSWGIVKDLLTLILPIITFVLGVWVTRDAERRRDLREKVQRKKTAARLTRRYLLFGEGVLKSVADSIESYRTLTPEGGGFFSAAYVDYAMKALSDFEEIKTRMIDLADDKLEEDIWRWHMTTMEHLRTFLDVMYMSERELTAKHGEWQNRALMFEAQYAMVFNQGHRAKALATRVETHIPPADLAELVARE